MYRNDEAAAKLTDTKPVELPKSSADDWDSLCDDLDDLYDASWRWTLEGNSQAYERKVEQVQKLIREMREEARSKRWDARAFEDDYQPCAECDQYFRKQALKVYPDKYKLPMCRSCFKENEIADALEARPEGKP